MRPKIAPEAPTVTANAELRPERSGRAGESRDEVDEQEARRAERLLDDRAQPVEREHVEREVEDAPVEEHRRDEPVPVAVRDRCRTVQSPLSKKTLPPGLLMPPP